jgi:hypothetical protein
MEDGEFAPSFAAIASLAVAKKLASIGAQGYAQGWGSDWVRRGLAGPVSSHGLLHRQNSQRR